MSKRYAVVITASDQSYRHERDDTSGPTLVQLLTTTGFDVIASEILPDERELLAATLRKYAMQPEIHVVATTGGTGLGPRDVTPEATLDVIERVIPGMAEAMRMKSLAQTPFAMTSRQVAGLCHGTLIINFPGSPKAVTECFEVVRPVLHHVLDLAAGNTDH